MYSQTPFLLKPNGAPVFQDYGGQPGPSAPVSKIIPTGNLAAAERTVRAHNFVVGKKISNQTALTLFDMAKDSSAQEQSFPVKVLYVKPGVAKNQSLKTVNKEERGKENTQHGNLKKRDPDQQLREDVSLGEISGIFKKIEPALRKRGSKSEPQRQAEAKAKKQKEYAEQVRREAKAKQLARQASQPQPVAKQEATPVEAEPEDDHLQRVPHAKNRFKGEFKSLTKQLFHKAQA